MDGPSGGLNLTVKSLSGSMAILSSIIEISLHAMVEIVGMVTVLVVSMKSAPSEDVWKKWRQWERGGDR